MTNHPNPESDFTARPSCPDPIECGHEAALGQAREQARRLGLMVDEYGAGASALTDKLWRVRDLHRKTCLVARSDVPPTSFTCGLCEVLDAPAAVSVPPPAPRADDQATLRDRIAAAIWERQNPGRRYADCEYRWQADVEADADAVLAVLPEPAEPADRVAVLAEVADWLEAWRPEFFERWAITEQERYEGGVDDAAAELRRLADESGPCVAGEQQNETRPRRGDRFEAWLKAQRDEYEVRSSPQWGALDEVLDTYRLHADMGASLGEHVCEARVVGDCECLEQPDTAPAVVAQPGKGA